MPSFNFPSNPTNGMIVKNNTTGVSYSWEKTSNSWNIVRTNVNDALDNVTAALVSLTGPTGNKNV
jgi:hypothetical protein